MDFCFYSLYERLFLWLLWNWQGCTVTVHYYVAHIFLCDGGRNSRVGDLRNKLDRRHSPRRSYSPGRDARDRHKLRGHSPSRSLEKKSDRKRRKTQQLDGQSEFSGSLKISDGIEDPVKEGKVTPSDSKVVLQEQNHVQLKEVQLDINRLEHQKHQLEIYMEEKVQEADILSSRIKELETQLRQEKEECRRIASKIKKFVKAHNHHSRIQDELKRSEARLQKLGDQLGLDVAKAGGNDEDSSINIVSDAETPNYHLVGPQNDVQTISSPNKKKPYAYRDTADASMPPANLIRDGGQQAESIQLKKASRWNLHPAKSSVDIEVEAVNNGNGNHGPLADDIKLKREKNVSTSFSSVDKLKSLRSAHVLPSTGMAAHAVDEDVEIEVEKIDEIEMASDGIEKGATYMVKGLPFRLPPPPPVPCNAYLQHEGNDENIDVVG
ncbi:Zinc finger CCCH domain-containing protein [Melia azedarach]|uniref:Zinc finger CCCH domain-containing protein n=2 Tax=Melia azedarach TaxID=155640 RepID=A0ACC1Z2Z9_MELAZ|nr:Zinc finger CCCH domain-containing protein [Melia azedarach]KAJ4730000.1 Zinc finger CCCH domain-containing protein [Melia azedarach]